MDAMLKELVDGIVGIVDSKLVSIILYGSVARGSASEESDIDIALLLDGKMSKETEDKVSDLIVDLNLKYDKVFSVVDIDNERFNQWKETLLFYRNVENEGIVLWKAA